MNNIEDVFMNKGLSMSFKNMENKNGDKLSPCLTPKEHSKASLNLFPSLTLVTAQYMDLIIFKMFPLIPSFINFIQRLLQVKNTNLLGFLQI